MNSLPKDLYFLPRDFYRGTFCTSGKVYWKILHRGNNYSKQYSNDESFPLASIASFFLFLAFGSWEEVELESLGWKKWLKPCEGMKGFFSSKCWTQRWRWREFRKLLVLPQKKWEQKCDKWLRKLFRRATCLNKWLATCLTCMIRRTSGI